MDTTITSFARAEERLIQTTNEEIVLLITNEIGNANLEYKTVPEAIQAIELFFTNWYASIFERFPQIDAYAFQWFVFRAIPEQIHPMPYLKAQFSAENDEFFRKCKSLYDLKVKATHFGAEESYTIPLRAAMVELSTLDHYDSPHEKINCFCNTYDLLFAEIKTAMISMISTTDRENEIPVVNNKDMLPVLMITIINSKLVYMFSNLCFIRHFCYKLAENREKLYIFNAIEEAVNAIRKVDVDALNLDHKEMRSLDLPEIIGMMAEEPNQPARSLVEQENQRILDLITTSTTVCALPT